MIARVLLTTLLLTLAVAATACSGDDVDPYALEGKVVVVTGESALESFVLRGDGDANHQLVPGAGFNRGLEEMRELLIEGSAVTVTYERPEAGPLVALRLTMAG